MRRYSSSKLRVGLLIVLLGAAVFLVSTSTGFAQDAAAGGDAAAGATEAKPKGLMSLILSHPDPVFFIILGLSIIGITLIIQGFIKNRTAVMIPESTNDHIRELIQQKKFKELIEFTESDPSFVSRALNPALKRAPSFSSMKEAMETSIGEQTAEQFRKIEYLNIIGNLGPLLGLLGTVLGMIQAFQAVAAKEGQANVGELSAGISTALCHTFLGLALAVPCLAAFGVLRTIVDRLTVRGALVAEEMLLMVKPQEPKPATGTPPRPGAMPQPQVPGRMPKAPAPPPPSPTPLG